MPEIHLRQPQFVYSAFGPFTRHKERIKKFKQTGDTRYIYRNDLDKKSMGSGFVKDSSLTLADELHKPVIKKFNKRKVYS